MIVNTMISFIMPSTIGCNNWQLWKLHKKRSLFIGFGPLLWKVSKNQRAYRKTSGALQLTITTSFYESKLNSKKNWFYPSNVCELRMTNDLRRNTARTIINLTQFYYKVPFNASVSDVRQYNFRFRSKWKWIQRATDKTHLCIGKTPYGNRWLAYLRHVHFCRFFRIWLLINQAGKGQEKRLKSIDFRRKTRPLFVRADVRRKWFLTKRSDYFIFLCEFDIIIIIYIHKFDIEPISCQSSSFTVMHIAQCACNIARMYVRASCAIVLDFYCSNKKYGLSFGFCSFFRKRNCGCFIRLKYRCGTGWFIRDGFQKLLSIFLFEMNGWCCFEW